MLAARLASELGAVPIPELHFFDELVPATGVRTALLGTVRLDQIGPAIGATYSTNLSISPALARSIRQRLASDRRVLPIGLAYRECCLAVGGLMSGAEPTHVLEKTPLNWRYGKLILQPEVGSSLHFVHRNPVMVWRSYQKSRMNPISVEHFDRSWALAAAYMSELEGEFPDSVTVHSYRKLAADRTVEGEVANQAEISTESEPWKEVPDAHRVEENILSEDTIVEFKHFPQSTSFARHLGYPTDTATNKDSAFASWVRSKRQSELGCRAGWVARSVGRKRSADGLIVSGRVKKHVESL